MRRRGWRKLSPWRGLRKPSYKRNYRLREHEDIVLLREIALRGCRRQVSLSPSFAASRWVRHEPDRWDRQYLVIAFKRLKLNGKLRALERT